MDIKNQGAPAVTFPGLKQMQFSSADIKDVNSQIECVTNDYNSQDDRLHSSQTKQQTIENKEFDFQTLVETTNVMILIFQNNNCICYANPMVKSITDYTKQELLNDTDFFEQLQFDEKQQNSSEDNCNIPQNQEVSLLTKNGDQCWLDCSVRKIKFGQQLATLVTAVDVTKYKQTEYHIKQVVQQEQKLAQNKVEFASMISHELRTPLNVISFSSNLLQRYCDSWSKKKRQECLNRIQRGVQTISLLVDEVSIIGKAEVQKLRFEPQLVNVNELCQILLSDLQLANYGTQQINFFSEGDCSTFPVDKGILQLILTNLLENAIKYSPQNRAVDFILTTSFEQITFKIKDRGIGIIKSDLQKLFDPFYRGENVGKLPGNGLGLAVVKKLVDIHGGEITIDSQVGVGTEFIISLPK
jgi:PAS domain S-box-containing protein